MYFVYSIFCLFVCFLNWALPVGGHGYRERGFSEVSNFSSILSGCMTLSKSFTPRVQSPCKICHLQNEENGTYLEDQEVHHVRGLGTKSVSGLPFLRAACELFSACLVISVTSQGKDCIYPFRWGGDFCFK